MTFRRVLFCPPTYFEVRDAQNPFMRPGQAVDKALALKQWQGVRAAFEQAGMETLAIDPVADIEDMVFINNQVFVGESRELGPFIVPSRMRFSSRQREVPHVVQWFHARGYKVCELDLTGEYLEGHGDLLWQAESSKVWAGFGARSSKAGVERFAASMGKLGIEVVPLHLVDPIFYHLDTCLAPLSSDTVLIYPGAFSLDAQQAIHKNVTRAHEVSREEALKFVCNGVSASGRYITPQLTPMLERALHREKLTPVVVSTSQFEKSGGSVCCIKLFIV
jgi:N-dimethylarginine dimethylaminohydrolase